MKNKLPTAEEFLNEHHQISHYYDDKGKQMVVPDSQVQQAMIEFTKLHVQAALEAAAEQSRLKKDCVYNDAQECRTVVNKQSILNAYPENLIK